METMQPALKNGRNVWDNINMPDVEFKERIGRVRNLMAEKGYGLLLVYTTGLNDYGDSAYLTNFLIRLPRGTLVAVPIDGNVVTFFEGASRGLPSLKLTVALGELVAVSDMGKDVPRYLKEKGMVKGSIGIVGLRRSMPYLQFRKLMDELKGLIIRDEDNILTPYKAVKSKRELDQIRRASRILGEMAMFLKETPFPGAKEQIIAAELYRIARFERAEDVRLLIARPDTTGIRFRPVEDKPVVNGDKIVFYLAVEFERYWSEMIRTYTFLGEGFVEVENGDLSRRYVLMVREISHGVKVAEIYRKAFSMMDEKAFEIMKLYGIGNGIGLGLSEIPYLAEDNGGEILEGMAVSFRMAGPGKDGLYEMLGNTVIVGSDGGFVTTFEPYRPVES